MSPAKVPKDVRKSPRNDPMQLFRLGRPDHRVGLASASLPVGKDGTIVTIHDALAMNDSSKDRSRTQTT